MWKFTKYEIINHTINSPSDVPTQTRLSQEISKQMKALGFQFVGPVIIYSYLQAIGVINDHEMTCSFKNII
ncbi:DNA-3-methyladenine glycosylase I [Leuconostoc palmae]|uniref:DNA-3-methyladenine glycosylase I n=1 Tax=Leuconostoc palmae TaxID=501487 RepID=UPI001C7D5E0B|nr:DNA-3-methyladenine glycosylase I [Leuconostoc palmae]